MHERMFTWCSASTWATSRRSRERSSASTSTDTTNVAGCVVVPLDLDEPVGLADEAAALAQSARWTDTPRPRVTKPMISSPGTGVQHRDSRTITSSSPSTCTPVGRRSARGPRAAVAAAVTGSCSSPPRELALQRAATTALADTWLSPIAA